MKILVKLLTKWLGGKVRLTGMSEEREKLIYERMMTIEGILEFWEFQKQIGYQMYGRTDDRKYLGYVEMAETMLNIFNSKTEPEKEERSSGFQSSIE